MSVSSLSSASIHDKAVDLPCNWATEILSQALVCADQSNDEGEEGVDPAYVTESILPSENADEWMMPAYLSIFSLDELGMLYMLERMPQVTRPGALRMAQNRGLSLDSAHEVVDFHFSRKKSVFIAQEAESGDEAHSQDAPADKPTRQTRKQDKALDGPQVHVLGESGDVVASLALKGDDTAQLREDVVAELERTYQMVDVRMELLRMDQWLRANPQKRKTPRGVRRFVNTWLSNASDRERTRRDMMHAGSAPRNGFGTGVGGNSRPDEAARDGEDGLGDFLG